MAAGHISIEAIAQILTARLSEEQLLELLEVISRVRHDGWCIICGAGAVPLDAQGNALPMTDEASAAAFRDHHTEDCLVTLIERFIYFRRERNMRRYPLHPSPDEQARSVGWNYGIEDWRAGDHAMSDENILACAHRALNLQRILNDPIDHETQFIEGHLAGYRAAQEIECQILAARYVRQVR